MNFSFTLKPTLLTSGFWDENKRDWVSDGTIVSNFMRDHPCAVGVEAVKHEVTYTCVSTIFLQVKDYVEGQAITMAITHLTTFGAGFFVKPNLVDFSYVFAHAGFADNLTIYLTLIFTISVYIVLVVWARSKDKKDKEKVCCFSQTCIFWCENIVLAKQ
jgi:hypothetical protein